MGNRRLSRFSLRSPVSGLQREYPTVARCNTIPKSPLGGALPPVLGRIVDVVRSGVGQDVSARPSCRIFAVCPPSLLGTASMAFEIRELAQDLIGQEDWVRVHSRGCSQAHAGGTFTPPSHAAARHGRAGVDDGRSRGVPEVVRWPAAPPLPGWVRKEQPMRSVASCAEERERRCRRARASSGHDQPRKG